MPNQEQFFDTYTTVENDTWDLIAYKIYGDEYYMTYLQKANVELIKIVIFSSGTILKVPKIEADSTEELPPWAI